MGIFDKFKSQGRHKAKAKDMSDTAEQRVNEKTGSRYEDQVDTAQQRTEGALGIDRDRERPDQP
ncbi:antitoxin [Streptomyces griseus]|uniref:antitoxin n=1 Tax=Streptomyces griseus TaxID=1911 RepID=UPI00055FE1A7|nr:antitoxin [Streptomyces griseus]